GKRKVGPRTKCCFGTESGGAYRGTDGIECVAAGDFASPERNAISIGGSRKKGFVRAAYRGCGPRNKEPNKLRVGQCGAAETRHTDDRGYLGPSRTDRIRSRLVGGSKTSADRSL